MRISLTLVQLDKACEIVTAKLEDAGGDPHQLPDVPKSILKNSRQWNYIDYHDWLSGF